jgi:hypothetical protein
LSILSFHLKPLFKLSPPQFIYVFLIVTLNCIKKKDAGIVLIERVKKETLKLGCKKIKDEIRSKNGIKRLNEYSRRKTETERKNLENFGRKENYQVSPTLFWKNSEF